MGEGVTGFEWWWSSQFLPGLSTLSEAAPVRWCQLFSDPKELRGRAKSGKDHSSGSAVDEAYVPRVEGQCGSLRLRIAQLALAIRRRGLVQVVERKRVRAGEQREVLGGDWPLAEDWAEGLSRNAMVIKQYNSAE
ncbi:MAG: hypothetical protein Q9212_007375 [Teloschistes hypoglaucus]